MIVSTGVDGLSTEFLTNLNEVANNELNPIKYLSCDPGNLNGFCGYDEKYYLQFMMSIPHTDVVKFINQFKNVKVCVIESYRVYAHKAQQHINSDLLTPKIIGRVETWTELNDIQLITQPASIKTTGYKWVGKKPLPHSNPMNHALDAHIHFMYWAVKHGKINAADLLRRNNV